MILDPGYLEGIVSLLCMQNKVKSESIGLDILSFS